MKNLINNTSGYSLIEIIISVLIFALGFLGITKMEQYAIMGNSFSLQMTNTLNILDSEIEQLRGLDLDDPSMTYGLHDGGIVTHQGIDFNLIWTVNSTALGGAVNARQIDVNVTWTEKNTEHSITMDFIKSTSQ